MGQHIDINGTAIWVAEAGTPDGPPVLLLHGALSDSTPLLDVLTPRLGEQFRLVAFDRAGHGRSEPRPGPMTYQAMAEEATAVIDAVIGGPTSLVGWSDGGVTALHTALAAPEHVTRIATVGSNFNVEGYEPGDSEDTSGLRELKKEFKRNPGKTGRQFNTLVKQCLELWSNGPTLTPEHLAKITVPFLFLLGDDDSVSLKHAVSAYRALPKGQLGVVPGACHMLPLERPELFSLLVHDFLTGDDVPRTWAPVHRVAEH
ncbi:alpha/beta hydrolase [Kocuria tytonicola]|uniref:Alpha/beta hydrolase n=1 Tax=Kocuria tytonicola TaxID=2055946 RepID=A0A3L9L580_9MICC|nr:alpha/beta hydrolase [Kocuria tytonicola]RLY91642.1 alpha/beta hydrolase [Kocuria tytonicola]